MATLYDVLRASSSASFDELRSAFKRQALAVHPDKGGTKEAFQQVMVAFEVLSDPVQRKRYDARWLPRNSYAGPTLVPKPSNGENVHRDESCKELAGFRRKRKRNEDNVVFHATPVHTKHQMQAGKCKIFRVPGSNHQYVLQRLVKLLRQLSAPSRRAILEECLSHSERLKLEKFMRTDKASGSIVAKQVSNSSQNDLDLESCSLSSVSGCSDAESEDDSTSQTCNHQSMLEDGLVGVENAVLADVAELVSIVSDDVESDDFAIHSKAALALCDASYPDIVPHHDEAARGKLSIRGLSFKADGRYRASLCIESLRLTARYVQDLSVALDHIVVLTAIKRRSRENCEDSFPSRLREALKYVEQEHGLVLNDLELKYSLQLSKRYWVGNMMLTTPATKNLQSALNMMSELAPYQGHRGLKGFHLLLKYGPLELERLWLEFRSKYLEICRAGGWSTAGIAAKMDARKRAHTACRERQLEMLNRYLMASAEKQQRRLARQERRFEQRERHSMKSEDRLSCRFSLSQEKHDERVRRLVLFIVGRWRRRISKEEQKEQRAREMEQKQKERAFKEFQKKQLVNERVEARRLKVLRSTKWRAMNRHDLTMNDIFSRSWEGA